MAEAARACSNRRRALIGSWVTPPTTGVIEIERGGDEYITINHGCGGDDCGGCSNSGSDDGGDGDGDGDGGESDGGVGCGRADDDGVDEDDDGGYGGGESDNVTTVTGTLAMGLVVWVRVAGDEMGIGDGGKSLFINILLCPLNKFCLIFSFKGKFTASIMNKAVAFRKHVHASSCRTEACAKM